ncbi:hypothetical protein [Nocardiopsis lucentensis]|uniref:hypothetical protein n=1 Tax=Nocardiopsis lucentensis TaxID=53441 RepID=UPI00034DDED7|nr:hypothetical protein [Nocardiopsis lucentensis]
MLLGKDAILGANDIDYEDVPVPQWGGTVRVAGLSSADRDAYEASMAAASKGEVSATRLQNFRAKLVTKAIVNEQGERLFADADAKELGRKNGKVMGELWDVVRRLSGIGKDAVEEGKASSGSAPSSPSSTA